MPEWAQLVGMILIPLAAMMLGIHASAKKDRDAMRRDIAHVHDCVEKRASEAIQTMHKLDVRLAVIESRGHQVRRSDSQKQGDGA